MKTKLLIISITLFLGLLSSFNNKNNDTNSLTLFQEVLVADGLTVLKNTFIDYMALLEEDQNQVASACLINTYYKWQLAYLDIISRTELDKKLIKNVTSYERFAARFEKSKDLTDAVFPTLFDNIDLYINKKRVKGLWPQSLGKMTLDDPQINLLTKNMDKCLESKISKTLEKSADYPDTEAYEEINSIEYSAEFQPTGVLGLKLVLKRKKSDGSTLENKTSKVNQRRN